MLTPSGFWSHEKAGTLGRPCTESSHAKQKKVGCNHTTAPHLDLPLNKRECVLFSFSYISHCISKDTRYICLGIPFFPITPSTYKQFPDTHLDSGICAHIRNLLISYFTSLFTSSFAKLLINQSSGSAVKGSLIAETWLVYIVYAYVHQHTSFVCETYHKLPHFAIQCCCPLDCPFQP